MANSVIEDIPFESFQTTIPYGSEFAFFRATADHFYKVVSRNKTKFSFQNIFQSNGYCLGDAHPENFGFLIQNDSSSLFTANDVDDFGPCPTIVDAYRFLVGTRLYSPDFKIELFFDNYLRGLRKEPKASPPILLELAQKSQKRGIQINPKKFSGQKILRNSFTSEIAESDVVALSNLLAKLNIGLTKNFKIIDALQTTKGDGGSAGLLRYELLLVVDGKLLHLELKEQASPAIKHIATSPIPDTPTRIRQSLRIEQGDKVSTLYGYLKFKDKEMLLRPKYWGNITVQLSDNSTQENIEIFEHEAYVLGFLHSKSASNLTEYIRAVENIDKAGFESDIQGMVSLIKQKFASQ